MYKEIVIEFRADLTCVIKDAKIDTPIKEYEERLQQMLTANLKQVFDDAHVKNIKVFPIENHMQFADKGE